MTSNTTNRTDEGPATRMSSQDLGDGHKIQAGVVNKTAVGQLTVTFPEQFSQVPTVVVSSFWRQVNQVGFVETINRIDRTSFTINSRNAAADYFVTWIAYGR